MKLVLFLFAILTSIRSQTITDDIETAVVLIEQLRDELREEFDASGYDKPLLATTVRLIFHDCSGPVEHGDISNSVSICNGCVAFGNMDNIGLQSGAVTPLEDIYVFYQSFMSRADYWAAAATIAIEYAQELDYYNKHDALPSIPYYFGREDCSTSPNGVEMRKFPDGHSGWTESLNWFQTFLGFTTPQTIALIGAHTLGSTHVQFSGFGTRKWVQHSYVLNNQYYMDIIYKKWGPVQINCASQFGCKWEWHTTYYMNDKTLMFNSDMALWNNIEPFLDRVTGKVSCDWKTCPLNPETKDITLNYARENQIWLNHFAHTFEQLIITGYHQDDLLSIHVPRSTERAIPQSVRQFTSHGFV